MAVSSFMGTSALPNSSPSMKLSSDSSSGISGTKLSDSQLMSPNHIRLRVPLYINPFRLHRVFSPQTLVALFHQYKLVVLSGHPHSSVLNHPPAQATRPSFQRTPNNRHLYNDIWLILLDMGLPASLLRQETWSAATRFL